MESSQRIPEDPRVSEVFPRGSGRNPEEVPRGTSKRFQEIPRDSLLTVLGVSPVWFFGISGNPLDDI
jgi:hypothetical protein